MKTAEHLKKIYIQFDPDEEIEQPEADGITWCEDKINLNDIEYIRKDVSESYAKEHAIEFGSQIPLIETWNKILDVRKNMEQLYTEWILEHGKYPNQ